MPKTESQTWLHTPVCQQLEADTVYFHLGGLQLYPAGLDVNWTH